MHLVSSEHHQKSILQSTGILISLEQAVNMIEQQHHPNYQPKQDAETLCQTLRTKVDTLIMLAPSLASPAEEIYDDEEPRTVQDNEEHLTGQALGSDSFSENVDQDLDVEVTIEKDDLITTDEHEMDDGRISNVQKDRMIIAIDFGTTFTSVAYTVIPIGVLPEKVDISHVKCIGNYPGYEPPPGKQDFREDVSTELWYDHGRTGSGGQRSGNISNHGYQSSVCDDEVSSSDDDESGDQESRLQFDDINGVKHLAKTQTRATALSAAKQQYWGYEVQQKLSVMNAPQDEAQPLTRIKLNLVSNSKTNHIRNEIQSTLTALRKQGIINKDTDIYRHYLTHLLDHTKEQLLSSNDLQQDMPIEFVLCVPAKWPITACRVMQTALEEAVKDVSLSKNAKDDVCNLFIISEQEAAAECILAEAGSKLYVSFSNHQRPIR
jgi:hypothetical protein